MLQGYSSYGQTIDNYCAKSNTSSISIPGSNVAISNRWWAQVIFPARSGDWLQVKSVNPDGTNSFLIVTAPGALLTNFGEIGAADPNTTCTQH
jgi:hypothetical protein